MKVAHWAELLAAGAIGVVAGTIWQRRRAAALAAAAGGGGGAVPQALQNTALQTAVDVAVVPGGNITQPVPLGALAFAWLPIGGKWVSVDGAGVTGDPLAPQVFEFQGPIVHNYVWIDVPTNTTRICTVSYVVAPPTPSVTT